MKSIVTDIDFLKQKSEDVSFDMALPIAEELVRILMITPNAAGLAAPQIGILKRVCVCRQKTGKIKIYINPKIESREEDIDFKGEGCLSFPGIYFTTIRSNKIVVEDDMNGKTELSGFDAVCLQHEIDHLNGVVFHDRKKG